MTGPPDVRSLLAPLRARPEDAAVLTDFDGTLAPIVDQPAAARPLPGVAETLASLGARYARVAVISGRPAGFLREHLGPAGGQVVLSGLYGLEWAQGAGPIHVDVEAERWRDTVEQAATAATRAVPPGATVERKGLSVTLHWRVAREAEPWAMEWARDTAQRTGLVVHPGRMSAELRPPVEADKGSVVARLVDGVSAATFLGDDVGDLPAFAALDRPGLYPARIAVSSSEMAPALAEAADVVVSGPEAALAVLRWLAASGS